MAKKKSTKRTTKKTTSATRVTKKTTKKTSSSATATAGRTKKSTKKTAARSSTRPAQASPTKKTASSTRKSRAASAIAASNGHLNGNGHGNGDNHFLSTEELRKIKSGLTKRDLEKFERLLLEKRVELVGDVESLQTDARNGGGSISYEHMADVGTDSYEQEFTLGLVESERKLLREIDEALLRIHEGTYGVCIQSGQPIPKPRLEAKPWARFCIEVAREREKRGL